MAELGPRLGMVNRRVPALNVRISLHHTGPKGCGDPSQGHASGREGIGVSGSAVLLGECRGSVRRTSSSGSTLEAHRSKRCDHCLDEGAVAKEERRQMVKTSWERRLRISEAGIGVRLRHREMCPRF